MGAVGIGRELTWEIDIWAESGGAVEWLVLAFGLGLEDSFTCSFDSRSTVPSCFSFALNICFVACPRCPFADSEDRDT